MQLLLDHIYYQCLHTAPIFIHRTEYTAERKMARLYCIERIEILLSHKSHNRVKIMPIEGCINLNLIFLCDYNIM